jgi:hypothetical protein
MKLLTDESLGPDLVELGPYRAAAYAQPAGGTARGGDRFGIWLSQSEDLFFYLADAPGHGERGAAFWNMHDKAFQRYWEAFTSARPSSDHIREFARGLNDHLCGEGDRRAAFLCLLFGVLLRRGRLLFANCGYGNHALIATAKGAWWPARSGQLFGLKLGWVPNATWDSLEESFVMHDIDGVRRCVLITDGFLGDDHADPEETLKLIQKLAVRCASGPANMVIPILREFPHDKDDATVVLMERC